MGDLAGTEDYGQSEVSEDQEISYGQEPEAPSNPAWEDVLNDIPEGFRGQVEPHLRKWDEQVRSQFESRSQELRQAQEQLNRYQPFNEFVEQGVDPNQIKAANVLLQELTRDPKAFYQRLGEHYGFTTEQAKQFANEQTQQHQENYDDDEEQVYQDPRFDQLSQQQQQIVNYISAQAQLQTQQTAEQQIDEEMAYLESQVEGGLSPVDKREVLQRAIIMGQTNPDVTLVEAYNQWQDVKRQMFENTPSNSAPNVLSSSGSANPATPAKKPSEMSEEEFRNDTIQALMNLGR